MAKKCGKLLRRAFACLLVVVMTLTAVPMSGFVGLELPKWSEWFATKASAAEGELKEGYYTYTISDGKATITNCDQSISGNVTVPSRLGGYPVNEIDKYAFYYCELMTSVVIPDSVSIIGAQSFKYCSKLKSITFGIGVETIGDSAFQYCESLVSVSIPSGVKQIGDMAFTGCSTLQNFTVSETNKFFSSVNGVLFNKSQTKLIHYPVGKTNISYVIPNGVETIGIDAFNSCFNLENVHMSNSVTCIADSAFFHCKKLKNISMSEKLISIGKSAFASCEELAIIAIPDSVTSIGAGALFNTKWYNNKSSGSVYAGLVYYGYKGTMSKNTRINIADGTKGIAANALYNMPNLVSVGIPASVVNIGKGSFNACGYLSSINVNENNKYYSSLDGVLYSKDKTELIQYPIGKTNYSYAAPDTLKCVDDEAFYKCSSLMSVTFCDGLVSIGKKAFNYCSKLSSVIVPDSVLHVGSDAFLGTSWFNNKSNGDVYVGKVYYKHMGALQDNEKIIIKDGTIGIADGAFAYWSSLTDITFYNSVVAIGDAAFNYCDGLKDVYFKGYKSEWKEIDIGSDNSCLLNANIHFIDSKLSFNNQTNNVYLYTNANENNVKGVSLTFKGTTDEVKKFTTSRIKKWEIEDTSIAKYKSCELVPTVGTTPTEVVMTAYLEAKKEGETTFTATLDDGTTTKCKIVVKRPNELKMGIRDVGTYYAIDNVFFDEYGNFSSGALKIDAFLQNKIKDEIKREITDQEALKKLTEKELKINLSLNSIGLSLEPDVYTQKKEIILEKDKEDLVPYDEPLERKFCIYLLSQEVIDSLEEIPCTLTVRLSTLNSEGEYEEKVKSEIKFTLKSYKKQYINEHITALQRDGLYRSKVIDNSVAVTMDGLENKLQYKYFQYLKKGLVKTLADCVTDFTDVNAYQVILADYISTINSPDNIEKMALDYVGKEALSTGKRILNIVLDFAKRFYTDDALKKVQKQISNGDVTIDAVKDVMSGKTTSGPVYDIMQDMLKTSSGAKALDGALFVNNMVGDVMKKYGYVADTVNAAIETYNVVCSLNAYLDIQQEQKQVFVELRDQARADGNTPLAKALDDYIQYDSDVGFSKFSDSLIAAARKSGGKFLSQGVTVVTSVFGERFKEKLVGFLGEKVFNGAASAFAYMTAAIEGGKIISNILGNTDDYADAMGEIVIACGFRKSLFNTVMNLYTQMIASNATKDSNGAYLYARKLDCALEMLKFAENNTCNKTLDALKSTESSIVINFFQEKKLELKKQISLIQIRQVGLSDAYCHNIYLSQLYAKILATSCPEFGFDGTVGDEFEDTPYKTITIQCPVNVYVYRNGTLVTAIVDNKLKKSNSRISALVIGDEKYVCLPTSDSYTVKLIATDGGTMDYSVFEFDAGGQPIRNVSYDAVTLTKDQQFSAAVGKDSVPASSSYNLKTGTSTISPTSDDYVKLTALSFANTTENVYVDSTLALSVKKTPENAKEAFFKWESSDPTVAEVDSDGTITGIKAGTVEITCTSKLNSAVKATVTVTVKECSHSFSDYKTVVKSTCTAYGYRMRTCSVCGKTETKTFVSLVPHEPDTQQITVAATCTENAKKIRLCKNCQKTAETIEQPDTALGHAVVVDKAVAATCTKTGLTAGKHCSRCKAVLVARKTVAKKAHTYKTTVTPATTEKDGKAVAACTVCKAVAKTVVIPKLTYFKLSATSYAYDGKVKTPTVTIKDSRGTVRKLNTDYTLTYSSGRKNIGRYAVKVTLKGKYSGTKTLYFDIIPAQVSKPKATQTTSTVTLSWSKVAGSNMRYYVFSYNPGTKKYQSLGYTTGTSYTVKKLSSGTTYYYAVQAYNTTAKKWGRISPTLTTATKPGTPTLKAVAGTQKATLSWNKQTGATGYVLYMATSKTGKYTKIATLKGNSAVSYTKTGLTKGKTYYFKVIAYKTVGSTNIYGAYSSVKYVKVK